MHSLFSASGARKSDDAALTFLAQGIKAWLEAQLPKYAVIHPVQTSCLKNAVSSVEFLPELERGLAAAAATRAPAPDFALWRRRGARGGTPRTSATGSAAPTAPA